MIKTNKEPTFRRCENPLCRRVLWSYQHKYGTGLYCDEFCYQDSGRFTKGIKNTTSGLKPLRKPKSHTMFEGKNCNLMVDVTK